jgi:predicted nucleotidyltransferase
MTSNDFDSDEAKKYLIDRENKEKKAREQERKAVLQKVILILKKEFEGSAVEVYLVGSITRPYSFSAKSDVDIVLKNYQGDRFALWPKLESEIGRAVEIISFDTCPFKEFVAKEGLKVL